MAASLKRSKSSFVSDYFVKNGAKVQCKLCLKSYKNSGNTSNFIQHLEREHGKSSSSNELTKKARVSETCDLQSDSGQTSICMDTISPTLGMGNEDLQDIMCEMDLTVDETSSIGGNSSRLSQSSSRPVTPLQPIIIESFKQLSDIQPSGSKSNQITKAMQCWLLSDNRPADIVSGSGFRFFMSIVTPRYQVPHRTTIKRRIEPMFENAVKYLQEKLKNIKFCSLTTDAWTDSMTSRSYLGTTGHFITNFQHESYTIGLTELEESHTSEFLCGKLDEVVAFWKIDKSKIQACVTDSAANVIRAIELFIGKEKQVACFAHAINLAVKDTISAVPEFKDLINKVKLIVKFFHKSNNAASQLKKEQKRKDANSEPLKLLQDVETRWNSSYLMITRFLQLKDCITLTLQNIRQAPDMITKNEVIILEDGLRVLKPFYLVTNEICGEKHTTISKVIPILGIKMSIKLQKVKPDSSIGIQLKASAFKTIDKRFKSTETKLICSVATLLDPRFKLLYFKSRSCGQAAKSYVNSQLMNYPTAEFELNSFTNNNEDDNNESDDDDLWAGDAITTTIQIRPHISPGLHSNLKIYLDAPTSPVTASDPLSTWKCLENFNSNLCDIALQFLCVTATSVPAERLFSKAGNTINKKRASLSPKYLEKLLILSSFKPEVLYKFYKPKSIIKTSIS